MIDSRYQSKLNNLKHPPGPRNYPVVGQLLAVRRNPLGFLRAVAARYGDITYFKMGRMVLEPHELVGYTLPVGSVVLLQVTSDQ